MAVDTVITATGTPPLSARGGITTIILTHARPTATTGRAGLSVVSSSLPAPGTTGIGVAADTTVAADTMAAVATTDDRATATVAAESVTGAELATRGLADPLTMAEPAMRVVDTPSQVAEVRSTAVAT